VDVLALGRISGGPGLDIAVAVVVAIIVVVALVLTIRRRRERRELGEANRGRWWRGSSAPRDGPLVYQHREDSGQGGL
jgi:hypothetical protein